MSTQPCQSSSLSKQNESNVQKRQQVAEPENRVSGLFHQNLHQQAPETPYENLRILSLSSDRQRACLINFYRRNLFGVQPDNRQIVSVYPSTSQLVRALFINVLSFLTSEERVPLFSVNALLRSNVSWEPSAKKRALDHAVQNGDLKRVEWLVKNFGCPTDELCTDAASKGHLDILMWARANRCRWNEKTCAAAAEGGYLKVLQWAHENGCPWDESTCSQAAKNMHFNVLYWAYGKGCPWYKYTTF